MSNIALPPIDTYSTRTISNSVFHILRQHIIHQTFAPGQRLQVDELARQLGVSRTPVKDALMLLAAEGLVKISPRRATYVAELSVDEIIETCDVRLALELAAGERLVQIVTPGILLALKNACDAVEVAARSADNVEDHLERNFGFHELFVGSSGNRKLLELFRSLHAAIQIARVHYKSSSGWHQRLGQEKTEHQAIMQALSDGNAQALTAAIRAHLNRAKQSLVADMRAADNNMTYESHKEGHA